MNELTPYLDQLLDQLAPRGRTALLPALHAAQEAYGYLPEHVAAEIVRRLRVPAADVYGVIDFYTLFRTRPVGRVVLHVCSDPACGMAGADNLFKMMSARADTDGGDVTIERAPCLGLCDHAPALLVQDAPVGEAQAYTWEDLVAGVAGAPDVRLGGDIAMLTRNCSRGRATTLMESMQTGGYSGLRNALGMPPAQVIEEIKAAGLVGRGGAAFPTGLKWESAAAAPGETRYVVCNADEAEPGTFKDRIIMENDPHLPIEGMIIAAYAIGAHQGYWYVRGEYRRAEAAVTAALAAARREGLLGTNIMGSGFDFDIEVRRGAGAYVCGEETALFESVEGKRGFPRVKPPFPTTHGLFQQPTVINNVETLANVPMILRDGAAAYRTIGTEKSPGPKLFCVSGDVKKPGLYEVPFGVSLRHLLYDLCGGMRDERPMQAVLIGGAAGAFATTDQLDVRLSFEDLRAAGLPLGSGVITVFDDTRDLRNVLVRLAHFFAAESCGKCYPCQLGTQRQAEILQRFDSGTPLPDDLVALQDIGWTMTDASLCGLGQTAASAVLSAIQRFPHLFHPA